MLLEVVGVSSHSVALVRTRPVEVSAETLLGAVKTAGALATG